MKTQQSFLHILGVSVNGEGMTHQNRLYTEVKMAPKCVLTIWKYLMEKFTSSVQQNTMMMSK